MIGEGIILFHAFIMGRAFLGLLLSNNPSVGMISTKSLVGKILLGGGLGAMTLLALSILGLEGVGCARIARRNSQKSS